MRHHIEDDTSVDSQPGHGTPDSQVWSCYAK